METTIDFGAGDLAFWGPLAALGDGILPDNHPQKYERKYSTDVHNQYRGLAEGCLYEAASRGGRFLAGKVAVIAAGGCAYAAGAGFAQGSLRSTRGSYRRRHYVVDGCIGSA